MECCARAQGEGRGRRPPWVEREKKKENLLRGVQSPSSLRSTIPSFRASVRQGLFSPYPHSEDKETETQLRGLRHTSYQMPDAVVFP